VAPRCRSSLCPFRQSLGPSLRASAKQSSSEVPFSGLFRRFTPRNDEKKKGSGTPTNAVHQPPHHRMRLCPCGAARLSAFHHGSHQRESSSLRFSFRPGFLGRGLMSVTHHRLSQPGEAPPTPVVVPDDMMPEPPGSRVQVRPREPPSPRPPVCLRTGVLLRGRDDSLYVIETETYVNRRVTIFFGFDAEGLPGELRIDLGQRRRLPRKSMP
jgi:hypothetical protein